MCSREGRPGCAEVNRDCRRSLSPKEKNPQGFSSVRRMVTAVAPHSIEWVVATAVFCYSEEFVDKKRPWGQIQGVSRQYLRQTPAATEYLK
jgi:hypothetical protein